MNKEKLIKIIKQANGFDLDAWMKKNYNFKGNFEGAIKLLVQKNRYENLLNDVEFNKAINKLKKKNG